MKQINKKLSVILLSTALLVTQNAFAARLGKQRSMGMQRSTSNYQSNNSNYRPYNSQANPAQQQAPQRRSPGMGSVVAGAAAGAVGGYMLGKAMNSNERVAASQPEQRAYSNSESHIPWGIIAILGALLLIGLMIFRRKAMPQTGSGVNFNTPQQNNTNFDIPNIRKENTSYANSGQAQAQPNQQNQNMQKMADGIEAQYFLRQAKGMFLHIQSMNTPENVSEIAKYMTSELYAEMQQLINENDYVADFSQLDCNLLESTTENNNYIASVKFFGLVSDSPTSPAVNFSEIWHFIKPIGIDNAKWLVAGIQQETTN